MAWTNSKIFRPYLSDVLNNTTAMDAGSDTFYCTLWDTDITPASDVTAANSAYGSGVWTTSGVAGAQEWYESGQWAQGGVAMATTSLTEGAGYVMFDASVDTASGTAADLTAVVGAMVYDFSLATPVDNQGVCYNYFGGANTVTNGTFTVVWNANGVYRITL